MLYHLLYPLKDIFFGFNLFRYITFRAAMAALTAFIISLILGPPMIRLLQRKKITENIRKEDSAKLYELHSKKENTPTMGGVLILLALVISTLLWADIFNRYIIMVLLVTLWLGITGFFDDYIKQTRRKSKGLTAGAKLSSQVLLGLILGIVLFLNPENSTKLDIPFLKDVSFDQWRVSL